jgi:multiple sugar transport system permease protein
MALALKRSDLQKAQTRAGYLFILPSFTLYVVFVLAPVVLTFVLSFTYYDPMAGSRWVGLENFERFFTGDRSLQIFWNTLCSPWRSTARCPPSFCICSGSPISCR